MLEMFCLGKVRPKRRALQSVLERRDSARAENKVQFYIEDTKHPENQKPDTNPSMI